MSADAFRLWAESYDAGPNPLLLLGDRLLDAALGELTGLRVLDAGCGTGRWMRRAAAARAAGLDAEPAMLRVAPRGRVAMGRFGAAPFQPGSFDWVVAAFSLSYADDPAAALADLRRLATPGGGIAIVDLASEAAAAGWKRTFEHRGRAVEIPSRPETLEAALGEWPRGWGVESARAAPFGAAERALLGEDRWRRVRGVPAVRLTILRRDPV